jgi:2-keto-4-pentenoate hydratase
VTAPAFGYLLENAVLWSGRPVSIAGAASPHLECELCCRVGDDLANARSVTDVAQRISHVYPAFELVEKRVTLKDVDIDIDIID